MAESCRDERSDRREDNRGVELFRRGVARTTRPDAAERASELLPLRVAVAGEGENAAALPRRDLGEDVRCGTESVKADPRAVTGEL